MHDSIFHLHLQIVNNKYNGLDVKLFTYLVEDAKSLQIKEWSSTCTEM